MSLQVEDNEIIKIESPYHNDFNETFNQSKQKILEYQNT